MRASISITTLFMLSVVTVADVYEETVQTINPDPFWIDPSSEEYALQISQYEPFRARFVTGTNISPEIVILMEEGLAENLGIPLVQRWVDDIESEDHSAALIEVSYGTPEEIKDYLESLHSNGMDGAILVGNLPTAWFKMYIVGSGGGKTLPCDYFFMDLDGDWLDLWVGWPKDSIPGQDGYYDTIAGEVDPEIWIGRMKADNLGDQVELFQSYLDRNHFWRLTGDPEPVKALCYVDDDWAASGPGYASSMQFLYENVDLYNTDTLTTSEDYEEQRLPDVYSWISPFVHSSPHAHYWAPAAGNTSWDEIAVIDPSARFYNLFACSNARFTTDNHMGGVYAFCTGSGLAVVGSTTTGSMLWFSQFYGPLGGRASLGEAWKIWWSFIAYNGFSQMELDWLIGMVLIGDPTLIPAKHLTGITEPDSISESLELCLNPNPSFGIGTRASFSVVDSGHYRLEVFDLSGRSFCRTSEKFYFAGNQEVTLPDMTTGIYLVRVFGEGLSASEKLIVIDRRG